MNSLKQGKLHLLYKDYVTSCINARIEPMNFDEFRHLMTENHIHVLVMEDKK
jgi:hypothetical protein